MDGAVLTLLSALLKLEAVWLPEFLPLLGLTVTTLLELEDTAAEAVLPPATDLVTEDPALVERLADLDIVASVPALRPTDVVLPLIPAPLIPWRPPTDAVT